MDRCEDRPFKGVPYCIGRVSRHRDTPIWKSGKGINRFTIYRIRLCTFHYNMSVGVIPIVSEYNG